jgi:hypothetical protein
VVFFEPMILLAGLAAVTRHIGLTATVSTTYNEPYNVARVFASLDHMSNGRAGWNVVTTGREAAAPNYGQEKHMQHADRYHRAHEFLDVVKALWDSWDEDAFLHDKAGNPVHWMSLKGKQFQQFGGTAGLEKHPSMMRALEHLKNARETFHPDSRGKYTNNPVLPSGHAYHVNLDHANNLEDRDLIHKEMYGIDHGKEHGKNNVHAIYGGDTIKIKKTNHPDGNVYEFDPDAVYSNMHNNSDSDVADAKVLVTPREEKNQHGTGGRVMVAPTYLSPNSKDAVEALRTGVGYVKGPRKNASKKVPTSSVGGMDFRSPVEREEHA